MSPEVGFFLFLGLLIIVIGAVLYYDWSVSDE